MSGGSWCGTAGPGQFGTIWPEGCSARGNERAAASNRSRSHPTSPSASASSRTDSPRGRRIPLSRSLIARALTPDRPASCSCDSNPRCRWARSSAPKPVWRAAAPSLGRSAKPVLRSRPLLAFPMPLRTGMMHQVAAASQNRASPPDPRNRGAPGPARRPVRQAGTGRVSGALPHPPWRYPTWNRRSTAVKLPGALTARDEIIHSTVRRGADGRS
jgi:hypothetical protein